MQNGYPLIVFSRTDMSGHFFPIAFMVTTYEKEIDFRQFYKLLASLQIRIRKNIHACLTQADYQTKAFMFWTTWSTNLETVNFCYYFWNQWIAEILLMLGNYDVDRLVLRAPIHSRRLLMM